MVLAWDTPVKQDELKKMSFVNCPFYLSSLKCHFIRLIVEFPEVEPVEMG
jgi:hypothetical protein